MKYIDEEKGTVTTSVTNYALILIEGEWKQEDKKVFPLGYYENLM